MLRAAVIVAALAGLTGAAQAEPGKLAGMGANLFGNSYFHFGEANMMKSFPVGNISFGRVRIDLQHTKLADVQRAYGGTIYEEGSGMGIARWLCYQGPQAATWLMSNALGGGEFIMMVATQAGTGGGSCDAAPANLPAPVFGIPGLGGSTAEIKAKLGSANPGGRGEIAFRIDRPARDGLGTANDAQYIGYMVRGGSVVGVGVGETTAQ